MKKKINIQPCWIVVPPTILYYNQTPCLTNCSLPYEWLSERLENWGPCEDKDANVTAFVKAPWRNDTDDFQPRTLPTLSLKTHIIPKRIEFYYNMKAAHTCFFKWYVTRRNKTVSLIRLSWWLTIHFTSPHRTPRTEKEVWEASLNLNCPIGKRGKGGKRWFCSNKGAKLCRLDMEKTLLPSVTYSHPKRWSSTPSIIRGKG